MVACYNSTMEDAEHAAAAEVEPKADKQGYKTKAKDSNSIYTRKGNSDLKQLTGREDEFQELGDLTSLYEGLSTHARQHVNPLGTHFQKPTPAPDWQQMFADPTLPLQVDIGCGSGRFVLIRAQRLSKRRMPVAIPEDMADLPAELADSENITSTPATSSTPAAAETSGVCEAEANVLGLEIRDKLVDRAQAWSDRLKLSNCRFLFTNATVSFKSLLKSYPGPVELVSMQFPDPYFKKKHFKRRHVQPQLVREMADVMSVGSRVFLQGDVPEAVRWMRDMCERHCDGRFRLAPECLGIPGLIRDEWETPLDTDDATNTAHDDSVEGRDDQAPQGTSNGAAHKAEPLQTSSNPLAWSADTTAGFLKENPLGVPTEREVYVAKAKAPVYRVMLVKHQ